MKERKVKMKWLRLAMGFMMTILLTCAMPGIVKAATVKLGDVTYTTTYSGSWPKQKTTIYRQKKGSSRKKIKTVNGYAYPKYEYGNVLYLEKDNVNDPMSCDLWSLNLSSKSEKRICTIAEIKNTYKQYLILGPSTGNMVPLKYSVYNCATKKLKVFSTKCLFAKITNNKIYFAEGTPNTSGGFGYKGKMYRCSLSGSSKKSISGATLTMDSIYTINSKYIKYSYRGSWYQYTYATKKKVKIARPF